MLQKSFIGLFGEKYIFTQEEFMEMVRLVDWERKT